METYWLLGPKTAYTRVIEQDSYDGGDEERTDAGYQHSNMFELPTVRAYNQSGDGAQATALRKASVSSNSINKGVSTNAGQCPFSGLQMQMKPSLI